MLLSQCHSQKKTVFELPRINNTLRKKISLSALTLLLFCSIAHPANVTWKDTGTDFLTATNWIGDTLPTNDTTSDVVVFNADHTNNPLLTNVYAVSGINFSSSTGGVVLHDAAVGYGMGVGANGIVSSGTSNSNLIDMAFLDTYSGQSWNVSNHLMFSTVLRGSHVVTKTGAGTLSFTENGTHTSTGSLLQDNGAINFADGTMSSLKEVRVGESSANTNTLNVYGGTVLGTSDNLELAMTSGSVANVTIYDGSQVTVGDGTGDDLLNVGAHGTATLTLTGSGSTMAARDIRVGDESGAKGTFNISAGALLTSTNSGDQFAIGFDSASIGSAVISGAGTTALLRDVYVGYNSTSASNMTVSNSATVTSVGTMIVASQSNSNGSLTVQSGATINTVAGTSGVYIGDLGTGTLTGTGKDTHLNFYDDHIFIANQNGSNGYFLLSDSAKLTNTAGALMVGNSTSAIGSALISDAGTTALLNSLTVGNNTTSESKLTVSNSAVVMANGGLQVAVGANSNGTVTIQSGADVTISGTSVIGNSGTGTLTVTGSNSQFTSTGDIYIGNNSSGHGTLVIETGGTVDTAGKIKVGIAGGGSGTLDLQTSDGIVNGSNLELGGGTFNTNGNDQSVGGLAALTMTDSSIIDMGGSDSIINWSVIDENTWAGTLFIHNWSGTINSGGGDDRLIFDDIDGFNLSTTQVYFYSGAGTGDLGFGRFRETSPGSGYWELVPAPEASTYAWAGLLVAFIGCYEVRKKVLRNSSNEE